MGLKDLFEGSHLLILIIVVAVLFGWKQLPDAARGLGRSMRILKSEVDEMKNDDGKSTRSPASSDVKGDSVRPNSDPNVNADEAKAGEARQTSDS